MNYLVYLVYPALAVFMFWGAKVYGKKTWNEEFLSLSQTKALQGFAAIGVMLHHIGQKTCAPWNPARYTVHGLDVFVPIGYLFVGIFLFCSGFGLYKSFHKKEGYLKGFFGRRVLPILLAYYSTGLIFMIVRAIEGEEVNIVTYITGIKLWNPNGWYAVALPILYLGFYLSFKYVKSDRWALFCTGLYVFAYMFLGTVVNHNDWWFCGEWWYNSVHLFFIGMVVARFEKPIVAHVHKFYWLYLFVMLFGIIGFYNLSEKAQATLSYYGELMHVEHVVLRRWGCLLTQMATSSAFVFLLFIIGMKIRIGNRALKFMGSITLEFYLIHGLFVELFGYSFLDYAPSIYYIKNVALHVLVVLIPSIPLAWLLQKFHNFIQKKWIRLFTRPSLEVAGDSGHKDK